MIQYDETQRYQMKGDEEGRWLEKGDGRWLERGRGRGIGGYVLKGLKHFV